MSCECLLLMQQRGSPGGRPRFFSGGFNGMSPCRLLAAGGAGGGAGGSNPSRSSVFLFLLPLGLPRLYKQVLIRIQGKPVDHQTSVLPGGSSSHSSLCKRAFSQKAM